MFESIVIIESKNKEFGGILKATNKKSAREQVKSLYKREYPLEKLSIEIREITTQ